MYSIISWTFKNYKSTQILLFTRIMLSVNLPILNLGQTN